MKVIAHLMVAVFLILSTGCCDTRTQSHKTGERIARPELLNVQIPAGLIARTDAQKELVANVKTLWRGMSLIEAKRHLGTPTEEKSDLLFYKLIVNRVEGGRFVTARLTFDDDGLSDAKLWSGHETRAPPRFEE